MFCKRIIGGVVLKRNVAGTFRTFSENVPATVSRTLPSNLKLADESVLDAPPEPIVPEVERYFPRHPSQIPTETDILSFGTANDVVGKFPLDATVFGAPYRSDIINNVVRYLRHKRRQPKSTKRISDISGSNAKPYPQKGQGKSQVGNKRNSAWRHGQKAHGPKARDYSIGMPKKVRALGMMIVLSAKLREGNLIVLDNFNVEVNL